MDVFNQLAGYFNPNDKQDVDIAKKEAERLIDLFHPLFQNSARDELARQCALITIKEIIKECGMSPNYDFYLNVEMQIKKFDFNNL